MKTNTLLKYFVIGLLLIQFESVLASNSNVAITSRAVYEKVFTDLKSSKLTQSDLQRLGPGVTGGGDSCEQKIAYSYSFLLEMIEKDKIPATVFQKDKDLLLSHLKETKFSFDRGLEKGRPVEMLNAPIINAILLDRSICDNNFEPLSYYSPLLMHEALRLMGSAEADTDYAISKSYVGVIRKEADAELNSKRKFRILSGTAIENVAMAWGFKDEELDFEKLDSLNETEQREYIDKNYPRIENYLIDLKRMRIITVLRSGDKKSIPVTELNGVRQGNNHHFEMFYDSKKNIVFTHAEWKWDSKIEMLIALDEKLNVIGQCDEDCANNNPTEPMIEQATAKALTTEQRKVWSKFSAHTYSFEMEKTTEGTAWKSNILAQLIKQDGSAEFDGAMKLDFKEGNFNFTFTKFKMKSEK
jgi:hypothetical protein